MKPCETDKIPWESLQVVLTALATIVIASQIKLVIEQMKGKEEK